MKRLTLVVVKPRNEAPTTAAPSGRTVKSRTRKVLVLCYQEGRP